MHFSNQTKAKLFALLILLNVLLRWQLVHHETGTDSFEMHLLANSISEFGKARWWVHPLSIIGMYPNSYASAISFFISGISQSLYISIEQAIFVYSIIVGLFGITAIYLLAGAFYDDDFFKFIVALLFSISPGVLEYSTWTAQGRSFFILMFPILLYTLIQTLKKNSIKFGIISVFITLFLMTTHHLFFYLIPIFFAYLIAKLICYLSKRFQFIADFEFVIPSILIIVLCLILAFPFVTGKFMTLGSRWANVPNVLNEYPRYIGFPIFFSFGGFFFLIFKKFKKHVEWFILLALIFLLVFVFDTMYTKWIMILFGVFFAGLALYNVQNLNSVERKYRCFFVIAIILISSSLAGYVQIIHLQLSNYDYDKTIDENTFVTGLWIAENIQYGVGISNSRWDAWKLSAISTQPFLTGSSTTDQAYALVDARDFELGTQSILSEKFWKDSPYYRIKGTTSDGYWQMIMSQYESSKGYQYIDTFNITYLTEFVDLKGNWKSHHGNKRSEFVTYVYKNDYCIVDTGKWKIWKLK